MSEQTDTTIREQLSRETAEDEPPSKPSPAFEDAEAEAAYWRTRFEQERERLAKLWVAYRDVEAELELRKEEAETIAQRKAAAQLAQAEQAAQGGPDEDEAEQPGVLAIAPPDEFEVVCEAEERDVVVGRGTSFPLVFVNRSEAPVTARLSIEESAEGWSALSAEEEIEFDGQSSQTVYVLVRPPAEAPVGEEGRVLVAVETDQGTEHLELVAEVVEPPEPDEAPEPDEDFDAEEPVAETAEDEDVEVEEPEVSEEPLEEEPPEAAEEEPIEADTVEESSIEAEEASTGAEEESPESSIQSEASEDPAATGGEETVDGGNGAPAEEEEPIEAQATVEGEGTIEDDAPEAEDEDT